MAGQEAIWHLIIDGKEQGPLTTDQVLEYLRNGWLAGSDHIWRPGFPDWKLVSEIAWRPPQRTSIRASVQSGTPVQSAPEHVREPRKADAPSAGKKWSVWKSANIGLLLSAITLLTQIGTGRGFEVASYAHTASAETIAALIGQIGAAPLIFVLVAVVRNLLNRRLPKSSASTVRGALTFVALFVLILGALVVYGQVTFSSTETISGEARTKLIADMYRGCIQKQHSLGQNATEAEIERDCACLGGKVADSTTYKQLGTELDTNALAVLKQKVEAAAYACQVR